LSETFGFLGAGNMAEAFCTGMVQKGGVSPSAIWACDVRPRAEIGWLDRLGILGFGSAEQVARKASTLVVAVKPKDVPALLQGLAASVPGADLQDKRIISIAAGLSTAKLEGYLAPAACPVVRVMPNTPAMVGLGASAYCLGRRASEADAAVTEAMLRSLGLAVQVDETQMDAVTALSGSGPAYVFLFMEALQAAGERLGLDPEVSFSLASQTLRGAAVMVAQRGDTPGRLREKVTSPGGTTAAALKVFEDAAFRELVAKAMQAAAERSRELGK
jgi:pyrroline-5-carboxylate reductase